MCAYTESHQSLLDHRKTLHFARELGVDQVTAIGHLHIFWWWALDNAPDGVLTRIDPGDIAAAARFIGLSRVSSAFLDALILAGFVDKRGHGKGRPADLQIHDWEQYGGKLLQSRAANKERMRRARAPLDKTRVDKTRVEESRSDLPPPPTPSTDASTGAAALDSEFGHICSAFEDNGIGKLTPASKDRLAELSYDFSAEWFEAAVEEAVTHNARNLAYVEAVLKRWQTEGFQSGVPPGKTKRYGQVMHGTPRARLLSGGDRPLVTGVRAKLETIVQKGAAP